MPKLRAAEWADIDLEAAERRCIVRKTRTPHIVPPARQAVEILREIEPLTGRVRDPNGRAYNRTAFLPEIALNRHWPSGGVVSAEAGVVFGAHGMGKDSAGCDQLRNGAKILPALASL